MEWTPGGTRGAGKLVLPAKLVVHALGIGGRLRGVHQVALLAHSALCGRGKWALRTTRPAFHLLRGGPQPPNRGRYPTHPAAASRDVREGAEPRALPIGPQNPSGSCLKVPHTHAPVTTVKIAHACGQPPPSHPLAPDRSYLTTQNKGGARSLPSHVFLLRCTSQTLSTTSF